MWARRRLPLNGTASVNMLWWPEDTMYHSTYSCICWFYKPFKLHNDACGTGLGAVLYQTQEDGTEAVIAYASRSLNIAESHYPAYKLEFLALKWAGSRNSMNTCMGQPSMCTPTIIHSPITDYSQAGFSHPSLGSQFGKLQFQVALSGRQNQHQCQCSI